MLFMFLSTNLAESRFFPKRSSYDKEANMLFLTFYMFVPVWPKIVLVNIERCIEQPHFEGCQNNLQQKNISGVDTNKLAIYKKIKHELIHSHKHLE